MSKWLFICVAQNSTLENSRKYSFCVSVSVRLMCSCWKYVWNVIFARELGVKGNKNIFAVAFGAKILIWFTNWCVLFCGKIRAIGNHSKIDLQFGHVWSRTKRRGKKNRYNAQVANKSGLFVLSRGKQFVTSDSGFKLLCVALFVSHPKNDAPHTWKWSIVLGMMVLFRPEKRIPSETTPLPKEKPLKCWILPLVANHSFHK